MLHQLPDDLPVHAVKYLLEIHEDAVQGGLPLEGLFSDDSHCSNVVCTGSLLTESSQGLVQGGLESLKDNSRQHFPRYRKEHDPSPIVAL